MEPRQLTALVVDDDMMVRMIHRKMLNSVGVKNQVVENGKEAIDIHRSGQSFDLILMDMDMPIMNGIEVIACVIHTSTMLQLITFNCVTSLLLCGEETIRTIIMTI